MANIEREEGGHKRLWRLGKPNGMFFHTLCKEGGGEWGSNPCVKIHVANLYNSGGLLAT